MTAAETTGGAERDGKGEPDADGLAPLLARRELALPDRLERRL